MKAGLLLRTIAHLRWEQLAYRPIRRLQSQFDPLVYSFRWKNNHAVLPGASLASRAETIRAAFDSLPHLNLPLSDYDERISDLAIERFTFLNDTQTLSPIDWNRRYCSHLWSYHLHYFDYAVWCARAFAERGDNRALETLERLISSWLAQARVGVSDGWDAYPVSLRIVNWTYAYALLSDRLGESPFLDELGTGIRRQVDYLSRHIEYHLLANHIIKNAKAMLIGGLLFGEETWITFGRRLLFDELDEQVLEDGGHFERSPMYHAQVLADTVEAYVILAGFDRLDGSESEHLRAKILRMGTFLAGMTRADGSFALFNDSANREELKSQSILESVSRVAGPASLPATRTFPSSGYYIWESSNGEEKIIVDAGPPSVKYSAAHAHCDLLSYELYVGCRPLIVDSGVHGYRGDEFREYARSTRAHNTVMFDGREQSEVWDTFRMGARAEVVSAEAVSDSQDEWCFKGAYRPYFARDLIHERRIERSGNGDWLVADNVIGGQERSAVSYIHLHPDVSARQLEDHRIECQNSGIKMVIEPFGVDGVEIVQGAREPIQGWYFPDFGIAQPNATICLRTEVKPGLEFGYRIRKC